MTSVRPDSPRRPATGLRSQEERPAASAPTCRAPVLWPSERRTFWWYLVSCPTCRRPHLGRARELDGVPRTRHLPCGHKVAIVVARVYGRPESQ